MCANSFWSFVNSCVNCVMWKIKHSEMSWLPFPPSAVNCLKKWYKKWADAIVPFFLTQPHLYLLGVTNAFPPHHLQLREWLWLKDGVTPAAIQIKCGPGNWNLPFYWMQTAAVDLHQYLQLTSEKALLDICMLELKVSFPENKVHLIQ